VATLDTNGTWLWAVRGGGTDWDSANAISCDAAGNSYITGFFWSSATFGSTTLTSSGSDDIFVAKLDSSGNWLWAVKAGGTGTDRAQDLALDASGCHITGSFPGAATFGSTVLTSSGSGDIFVAKVSTSGSWLWATRAGGTGNDIGNSIVLDTDGSSYVCGIFEGSVNFGEDTVISNGGQDFFVAKITDNGSWLWVTSGGGATNDVANSIAINSSRNCHITGYFSNVATIGATTLTSSGGTDVFTAKLESSYEPLEIIVGNGTSNLRLPVYVNYGYTYSQSIFYPSELSWPTGYRIDKIYYWFNGATTYPSTKQFVIYMGHTSISTFASSSSWIPLSNLTEVYDGINIPQESPGGYWMEFDLDTPFIYNGVDNLVIAVDENQPGYDSSISYFHSTSTTGVNRSIRYFDDDINPDPAAPPNGTRAAGYPNIKFFLTPIPETPELAVIPGSWDFGSVLVNSTQTKQFTVKNTGTGILTIGSITIPEGLPFTLISLPSFPLNLEQGETANFTVQYAPTETGPHSADISINDNRALTLVNVSGLSVDPRIASLPYEANFDEVVAPDLSLGWTGYQSNTVMTVATTSGFSHTPPNSVLMTNSTSTTGALRLISPQVLVPMSSINLKFYARGAASNYTLLVGTVSATDGSGVFTQLASFTLSTSFTQYTLSFAGYTGTDQYICFQHGLLATSRTIYIDTVMLEEILSIDMAATAISGGYLGFVDTQMSFNVTVYNNSTAAVDSYTVYLKRSGGSRLATLEVNTPLEPANSAVHTLNWTPTVAESFGMVGEVEVTDDDNPGNDETSPLMLYIYPEDVYIPQIGDVNSGTSTINYPVNFFYRNSLSETIYLAQELQLNSGTIQGIIYQNNFSQNLTKPIRIWMKQTTQDNLATSWLDFTGYALVFQGNIHFPIGVNSIYIPLDAPFNYTGDNLAVRVYREWEISYWNNSNFFYNTASPIHPNRTRHFAEDTAGSGFNPTNPPSLGTVTNNVANTAFIVDPADIIITLDTPEVTITKVGSDVRLDWQLISGAHSYDIYSSVDPYLWPDDPDATVYTNSFQTALAEKKFFKVVASTYRNANPGFISDPAAAMGFDNSKVIAEPLVPNTKIKD